MDHDSGGVDGSSKVLRVSGAPRRDRVCRQGGLPCRHPPGHRSGVPPQGGIATRSAAADQLRWWDGNAWWPPCRSRRRRPARLEARTATQAQAPGDRLGGHRRLRLGREWRGHRRQARAGRVRGERHRDQVLRERRRRPPGGGRSPARHRGAGQRVAERGGERRAPARRHQAWRTWTARGSATTDSPTSSSSSATRPCSPRSASAA